MTTQEAKKIIKQFRDRQGNSSDDVEAFDMAINALEQTELNPSYNGVKTELKPCEDCISRKRVIMLIDEAAEKYPYKIIGLPDTYSNYNQGWTDACDWLYANIESDNLPSVTPKFTDDEIQKMQELEQAQLEKAYELGKVEMQPSEDCVSREILDKIKAEIDKKQYYFMATEDYDEGIRFGLMLAYQIIDKYIIESEDAK